MENLRGWLKSCLLMALIALFPLQGCAPLASGQPDVEERQTRERLASLKQELKELQAELARARAEQSVAPARPAEIGRAWQPLDVNSGAPGGYARYGYLLLTADSSETDRIALATLIDTLPVPGDLAPVERTLLLLPYAGAAGAPLNLANYRFDDAAGLLAPYRKLLQKKAGPFLLLTGKPLSGSPGEVMILDLAGRDALFLKRLLTGLQLPQGREELAPRDRQARRLMTLVEISAGTSLLLTGAPDTLVVTWTP